MIAIVLARTRKTMLVLGRKLVMRLVTMLRTETRQRSKAIAVAKAKAKAITQLCPHKRAMPMTRLWPRKRAMEMTYQRMTKLHWRTLMMMTKPVLQSMKAVMT